MGTIRISSIGDESFVSYASSQPHGVTRGYYNGENLYLLPSCVCSLMTNVSPDIRGHKDSYEDVLEEIYKLHIKGFGCCFNSSQKESFLNMYGDSSRFSFDLPSANMFK